jgi:hypothetical protein
MPSGSGRDIRVIGAYLEQFNVALGARHRTDRLNEMLDELAGVILFAGHYGLVPVGAACRPRRRRIVTQSDRGACRPRRKAA